MHFLSQIRQGYQSRISPSVTVRSAGFRLVEIVEAAHSAEYDRGGRIKRIKKRKQTSFGAMPAFITFMG
jgi:hypothetical protein